MSSEIDVRDFSARLMEAVTEVQGAWIAGRTAGDVFEELLGHVLRLTDSEYGYIGEVKLDEQGTPYLLAYALTDISWDDHSRALVQKAHHGGGFPFRDHNTLYGQVLVTGKAVIANDAPNDPRAGGTAPGHLPLDRFLGLPLWSEGELVGSVGVSNRPGGYDEELVVALAPLLASCGTIIRAFRDRRGHDAAKSTLEELAQTLRESLLPPDLPCIDGLDVAARFQPASLGDGVLGDFYDIFPVDQHRWAFVIGDVQGHGADAAKTTARSRWTLQSRAAFTSDPSQLLGHLNDRLLARTEPDAPHLSAIALVLDLREVGADGAVTLSMCTAGHPPPVIRRRDGTTVLLPPRGTVLGVLGDADLVTREVRLEPGEALLLFTDGVTESHHRDLMRGEEELCAKLAEDLVSADQIADACMRMPSDADGRAVDNPDDSAILVIRVPA